MQIGGKTSPIRSPRGRIFEASVDASLASLSRAAKGEEDEVLLFGIVTAGKIWEAVLSSAIPRLEDGKRKEAVFARVETTGLTAVELHDLPEELVRSKLSEAASRLVSRVTTRERSERSVWDALGWLALRVLCKKGCTTVCLETGWRRM